MGSPAVTQARRMCVHSAARPAHRVPRLLPQEPIETLLLDSYDQLASTATVTRWLVVGAPVPPQRFGTRSPSS
jgi:hypothetical protein